MAAILYSFRRCPYAIRARLALACAGICYEHREVVLKNKPACMLALSPKGTVPVLRTPEGTIIDESIDIMYWALQQHDPFAWLNVTLQQCNMIKQNDLEFKPLLDRYKYPQRYDLVSNDEAFKQALGFLQYLNQTLEKNSFLSGKTPGIIDAAIFPFVRQFAKVDWQRFESTGFRALLDWCHLWLDAKLFSQVMAKYAMWNPDDPPSIIQCRSINII